MGLTWMRCPLCGDWSSGTFQEVFNTCMAHMNSVHQGDPAALPYLNVKQHAFRCANQESCGGFSSPDIAGLDSHMWNVHNKLGLPPLEQKVRLNIS